MKYLFTYPERELIYIAAIIEKKRSSDDTGYIDCYSLLTTEPNESVAPIHNRMPLLLDENQLDGWITDQSFADEMLTAVMPELDYTAAAK